MGSKNYNKGRKQEYKIVWDLRSRGWLAFRSAGSHSPVDVVAINPEKKEILLIQSKMGAGERRKELLANSNIELNGSFKVKFIIVSDFSDLDKFV